MTDYTDLQKAAEYAAQDTIKFADEEEEMRALQQFHEEVDPETVLALIAESESAHKHWQNESNNVQVLVAEVARLKAENEELSVFGVAQHAFEETFTLRHHELITERDQLRAEVAGLKTGYEAYERVNAELKAECEALRREREGKVLCDLELFETLRDAANTEADEHRQCMATYRPLRQANLDSVVKKCDDLLAAMGKGEQS